MLFADEMALSPPSTLVNTSFRNGCAIATPLIAADNWKTYLRITSGGDYRSLKRHDCNVALTSEALGLGSRQTLYKNESGWPSISESFSRRTLNPDYSSEQTGNRSLNQFATDPQVRRESSTRDQVSGAFSLGPGNSKRDSENCSPTRQTLNDAVNAGRQRRVSRKNVLLDA